MSEKDPLSQVYDALWDLLEVHVPLTSLVKAGNRVKFSGTSRDPEKERVSTADLPEIRIIPLGGTPHIQRTSNGSSWVKRFAVILATGDKRVDVSLFPVEWEIYRAMAQWADTLTALTWNDKPYIKLARPVSATEGISDRDLQRGVEGWTAVWQCEVELWFTTADLKEE